MNNLNDNTVKTYDLEDRTFEYALAVRDFLRKLPRTISNREDGKQLIRSSGSVGANYLESKDSLGKKDMVLRLRIARKEAKESRYWLKLLKVPQELQNTQQSLINETTELLNILSAIINKQN